MSRSTGMCESDRPRLMDVQLALHCLADIFADQVESREKVANKCVAGGPCGVERERQVTGPVVQENLEHPFGLQQVFA